VSLPTGQQAAVPRPLCHSRLAFLSHGHPDFARACREMLGVWAVTVWQQMGMPSQVRLVEVGPGRGTLMADILRATGGMRQFAEAVSVHLVEVSPALREKQYETLRCADDGAASTRSTEEEGPPPLKVGASAIGACPSVQWHASLADVTPGVPTIYILHELLDALPVHQFVRTPRGWREVLVDHDTSEETPMHFRFAISWHPTPASEVMKEYLPGPEGTGAADGGWVPPQHAGDGGQMETVELSGDAMGLCEELGRRVEAEGGAALLIDYGRDGWTGRSLIGIRGHAGVHPLSMPGRTDLSAWVDFRAMGRAARRGGNVQVHGPADQGDFLRAMGIDTRLEMLCRGASEEQRGRLRDGHRRVTGGGEEGMGRTYKVMALVSSQAGAPAGFG